MLIYNFNPIDGYIGIAPAIPVPRKDYFTNGSYDGTGTYITRSVVTAPNTTEQVRYYTGSTVQSVDLLSDGSAYYLSYQKADGSQAYMSVVNNAVGNPIASLPAGAQKSRNLYH